MENKKVKKVVLRTLEDLLQVLTDEGLEDSPIYSQIDYNGKEYIILFGNKETLKNWQK
jgi:hypothetical protein